MLSLRLAHMPRVGLTNTKGEGKKIPTLQPFLEHTQDQMITYKIILNFLKKNDRINEQDNIIQNTCSKSCFFLTKVYWASTTCCAQLGTGYIMVNKGAWSLPSGAFNLVWRDG